MKKILELISNQFIKIIIKLNINIPIFVESPKILRPNSPEDTGSASLFILILPF